IQQHAGRQGQEKALRAQVRQLLIGEIVVLVETPPVNPGGTTANPADLAKFTPNFSLFVRLTSSTSRSSSTSASRRSLARMMRSASCSLTGVSRINRALIGSLT